MKTHLALAVYIAMLLTGCTGMHAASNENYYAQPQTTPQHMGNGRRLESIPVADHPCEPANVYFIDEVRGVRQVVIDWDKLGPRSTYTLPLKGRVDLVKRIQKAGKGCAKPALIESIHVNRHYVGEEEHYENYAFVRYWLDGDVIRFKAHQFIFNVDPQTNQIKADPQGKLTDIDPQTGRMRPQPDGFTFHEWRDLETQWNYQPYNGPVATPQVSYRIDDHRFFEIVPYKQYPCGEARLFYNDTAKGIRTNVMDTHFGGGTFIIDAANDQYLVAPILNSSSGCQSGGSYQCSDRLYYSQDAGRTWKVTRSYMSLSTYLIGSMLYVHSHEHGGWKVSIAKDIANDDKWDEYGGTGTDPRPRKAPIDSEFHCNSDEKE